MNPIKSLIKPAEKEENPMNESEICYEQALGKALVGFAKALELRQGRIFLVTNQDILEYSDVDEKEYDFLFKDAYGLLEAMKEDVYKTFNDEIKLLEGLDRDEQLKCIFKRLRKVSPILTVLRLIGDHTIWTDMLRMVFTRWTADWPSMPSAVWEYMYRSFCCQFGSVLEKWEESGFDVEQIPKCIELIDVWLKADATVATATGN